jgi:uncharacterized protein YlzI (FlbEa/FlbD family)
MRLIKLQGEDSVIYINPEHVVAVRKALRNTTVDTVSGKHTVVGDPEEIARLLGAEEVTIDVTPGFRQIGRG